LYAAGHDGLVGDSLNPITEAIRRHRDVRWIHVHNEEAAAFAASTEAQVTGRPAVCAGNCGRCSRCLGTSVPDPSKLLKAAEKVPLFVGAGMREARQKVLDICCSIGVGERSATPCWVTLSARHEYCTGCMRRRCSASVW
jgi:thiamine pyrophosphate-dependent acetolactate synthase large subunit-like protein